MKQWSRKGVKLLHSASTTYFPQKRSGDHLNTYREAYTFNHDLQQNIHHSLSLLNSETFQNRIYEYDISKKLTLFFSGEGG